jgi:DNA repair protein RadC
MIKEKSSEEFHLGHRKRLKDRFLKSPIRSLPDYEILEMILFSVFPRKDTKSLAKKLLSKFGSLADIVNADSTDLKSIEGVGDALIIQMKLLSDIFSRLHLPIDKPITVLNNWMSVIHYCNLTMGYKKIELFRVLYLNKNNCLIADQLCEHGTVDRVQIYPREIAKKALECNASAIILVHNHPSGFTEPSKEDIEMTKQIAKALSAISVNLHDHLIISKNSHYSFRAKGLI